MRWLSSTIRKMIIFRNRAFGLLWTGQLLSNGGNWLLQVAVPVYVFHLTRSAGKTGLTVVAEILPLLALGPVAGVFADRWSRRRVVIGTNLLCAGAVLLLLLAGRPGQLWLVLLALVAENASGAFFGPAYQGLIPSLVGRDRDLSIANGWSAAAGGVVRLTCAPLGGVLYAAGGIALPVEVDAGTYVAAAVLVLLIRPACRSAAPGDRRPTSRPSWQTRLREVAAELRAGVAVLRADRVLRVLLIVSALFLLGNGACSALLVPYIVGTLHARTASIGELYSALGLGYLLSAGLVRRACASPRLRRSVLGLVGLLVSAFTGLFDAHSFMLAFVFMGLIGLGGGGFLMLEQTIMQRRAGDDVVGRISSVYSTIVLAATLAGALAASLAVAWIGRAAALNAAVAVIACGGVAAAWLPGLIAVTGRSGSAANGRSDGSPGRHPGADAVRA